jgi:Trypsin/PEP-CTERM motif
MNDVLRVFAGFVNKLLTYGAVRQSLIHFGELAVKLKFSAAITALALVATSPIPAYAQESLNTPAVIGARARTQTGSANGMSFTAASRIVGVGSTATAVGGGNPLYFPDRPSQNGVVALIIDQGAAGSFICSGSLLPDRRSILTAAHCVSDGAGTPNPIAATAFFYGGSNPDLVVPGNPASTAVSVSNFFVNPGYTGQVIDENDVAVLRLSSLAPSFARAYNIATTSDLEGQVYNIAGFGGRSTVGGNLGVDLGTGRLRQGLNRYDFRLGDPGFGGFFTDINPATGRNFFGTASIANSILADFDNGLPANDASCLLGGAFGLVSDQFCNLGVGLREVSSAGGDSGGPQFVNGRIASLTSYGLSFGANFGDILGGLQSSFGEFNGFVPTFIHADFINASLVPEPASWAMMIIGFGFVGGAVRRRRTRVNVSFA